MRARSPNFSARQRRPVAAFDVNPDEFKLLDYLPAYTAAAEPSTTRAARWRCSISSSPPDQVPKVVDLGHEPFDRFFAVMRQIDFAAEARRRAIVPMVLFVADPDDRARQGYAMLNDRFPKLRAGAGFNEYVSPVARYRDDFPPTPRGGQPVSIPALTPVVRSVVDRPGFSFVAYVQQDRPTRRPNSTTGCVASSSRSARSRCGCCSAN